MLKVQSQVHTVKECGAIRGGWYSYLAKHSSIERSIQRKAAVRVSTVPKLTPETRSGDAKRVLTDSGPQGKACRGESKLV